MTSDRKVAKPERGIRVKGVGAQRELQQPYASEVEDYASDAVKSPRADPRRQPADAPKAPRRDRN
jgi:hypothetical protein